MDTIDVIDFSAEAQKAFRDGLRTDQGRSSASDVRTGGGGSSRELAAASPMPMTRPPLPRSTR